MSAYRDRCNPLEPHTVVLDRVRLEFGAGGLLRNPDQYELATMTATPMRRERFVEEAAPAASSAPLAPPASTAPATSQTAADAAVGETAAGDDRKTRSGSAKPRQGSDA